MVEGKNRKRPKVLPFREREREIHDKTCRREFFVEWVVKEKESLVHGQGVVEVEPKWHWALLKSVYSRKKWLVNNKGKNEKLHELDLAYK